MQRQVTASEKPISEPEWSPDGHRFAFVRDNALWVSDVEGPRQVCVVDHPAGVHAPRWSPDGRRLAFLSRRRGWDQVWLVDAPVPRRGRPATHPKPVAPREVTRPGVDVEDFAWAPDGGRISIAATRGEGIITSSVSVVDLDDGSEVRLGSARAWETGGRWLPDGSGILLTSDESGWFQVYEAARDGSGRRQLTFGEREHGDTTGGYGHVALPSPDATRFAHVEIHDGLMDVVVAPLTAPAATASSRTAARSSRAARRTGGGSSAGGVINPWPGSWLPVEWLPDSSGVLAIGQSDRAPQDAWVLPAPDKADARARQVTRSLPSAVGTEHFAAAERVRFPARDGLPLEATLWRPAPATGRRGGERVPVVVHSHGGPTWQAFREWLPIRQLVVETGAAFLSVDFRGSTGYGREFRMANVGEWGHADAFDVIDAARWATEQPWCDGRVAHFGGSYGGYMTLCVLVEEPSLWRCGIDMYGDSEIAESFRHGDRVGRLDLERQMGRPDDPGRAEAYRRGSPVYRAERIEAPLLILHGRKDKRVVPLMTEKIVEALEIEGKHYQVHWYDEEGHGWERRENRRDAWNRVLEFLKRHLLDEPAL